MADDWDLGEQLNAIRQSIAALTTRLAEAEQTLAVAIGTPATLAGQQGQTLLIEQILDQVNQILNPSTPASIGLDTTVIETVRQPIPAKPGP